MRLEIHALNVRAQSNSHSRRSLNKLFYNHCCVSVTGPEREGRQGLSDSILKKIILLGVCEMTIFEYNVSTLTERSLVSRNSVQSII